MKKRTRTGLMTALFSALLMLPAAADAQDLPQITARLTAFADRFAAGSSPLAMPFEAFCTRLQRCLDLPDALDLWQEWRDVSAPTR